MRLSPILRYAARQVVIGLRREDKSRWERRAPFAPKHVEQLTKAGAQVVVQPSPLRVYTDRDYQLAGATVQEDLSPAQYIFAVKEVPTKYLLPDRTYVYFSHTIKAQPYNMAMLDDILQKRIRLIDYERIVDDNNARLVKFGKFAGNAGMIDALAGIGDRLLALGHATPFLYSSFSRSYPSLAHAKKAVRDVGQMVAQQGVPIDLHPFTFSFVGGSGAVGQGALEVFKELPHKFVTLAELEEMQRNKTGDRHVVYGLLASYDQFVERTDGQPYSRTDYHSHPEMYRSRFHEKVVPLSTVVVNCQYWEQRYPRLLTGQQLRDLRRAGQRKLVAVQDISMDINGSIEFTRRAASIDSPHFLYDPEADTLKQTVYGDGVMLLAVDILPAELPRDATDAFGDLLMPLVLSVAKGEPLPRELQRATITEGGALKPDYAYIARLREQTRKRRVLVLGAGLVAKPAVEYLSRHNYEVTIAADDVAAAEKMAASVSGAAAVKADASRANPALDSLIQSHDVVLSLLPAVMHPHVAAACVSHKKHLVTASYISPAMQDLDAAARAANVALLNELGLDPGIDHVEAMACMDAARARGGTIKEFISWCGGLPAPENATNPLGYKFSWSPRGVLNAAKASARYIANGQVVEKGLALDEAKPLRLWNGFSLEGYPNRDSTAYRQVYGIETAETVLRGTLRFEGYSEIMRTAFRVGLLDDSPRSDLTGLTWDALMKQLLSRSGVQPAERVMQAFRWLGLFDSAAVAGNSVIDAFCGVLQRKLALEPMDRDLVLMQHQIVVEYATGKRQRHTLSLVEYGVAGGETAMSRTVGLPAAIGVHLLLNGTIKRSGVYGPMTPDVYVPVKELLHEENIRCTEIIEDL